jgi:hypothetical protein
VLKKVVELNRQVYDESFYTKYSRLKFNNKKLNNEKEIDFVTNYFISCIS